MFDQLKQRAKQLKKETFALYLAARHPRTPWYAKLLVTCIVAYAFSPIDLIPDFVPLIGYLDDLLLLPACIALAVRLIPDSVLAECREQAQKAIQKERPVSRVAGVVIVLIWVILLVLLALYLIRQ